MKADSPSPSPHSASPAENALPPLLALFAGAMLLATLYLVFMWVPTERTMGIVQRIFYFKVGSAFVFIIGFVIGGVAAILYLVKREDRYDDLSVACNEVSLIFAVTVMIMGALWAKPAWGIYWAVRDPKLMATLMLALIYTAYLILRQSVSEPNQRAVVCAVVSIIGMVDIPFVYKAISNFISRPCSGLRGVGVQALSGRTEANTRPREKEGRAVSAPRSPDQRLCGRERMWTKDRGHLGSVKSANSS